MSDIKEQLFKLNKMSKRSVALYHRLALAFGISDSELGVLYALFEADAPCSQYELCVEWSIPKQTINTTVNGLCKKGFVCLTPVPGTRNKKDVALTAAGKEFAKRTAGILFDAEIAALCGLTDAERELYIGLNEKYNAALAKGLNGLAGGGTGDE